MYVYCVLGLSPHPPPSSLSLQEIDPTHNPVPFTPGRKVSYTFSLISTLEAYDYPMTPTLLEPDEMSSNESSPEATSYGSLAGQTDLDPSKRGLSPIVEATEDSMSVGKTNTPNHNLCPEEHADTPAAVKSELKKGYLSVEVANPGVVVTTGHKSSSFSGYVQDFDTSRNLNSASESIDVHQSAIEATELREGTCEAATSPGDIIVPAEHCTSNSGGYIESSDAFSHALHTTDEKESLQHSLVEVCCDLETNEEEVEATDSVTEQTCTSAAAEPRRRKLGGTAHGTSLSCHPMNVGLSGMQANNGYIPSHFSTASSGYGSEEGSFSSRFLSSSNYVPDFTTAYSTSSAGHYIPSSISTTSSGYYSSEASVSGSGNLQGHKFQHLLSHPTPDSFADSVFGTPEIDAASGACAGAGPDTESETRTTSSYIPYVTCHDFNLSRKNTTAPSVAKNVDSDPLPFQHHLAPTVPSEQSTSTDCGGCQSITDHRASKQLPLSFSATNPLSKAISSDTTTSLISGGTLSSSDYIDEGSNSGYIIDPTLLSSTPSSMMITNNMRVSSV